jgi:hypothetical protein
MAEFATLTPTQAYALCVLVGGPVALQRPEAQLSWKARPTRATYERLAALGLITYDVPPGQTYRQAVATDAGRAWCARPYPRTSPYLKLQYFGHQGRGYTAERLISSATGTIRFLWIIRTEEGALVGEIESSASWTVAKRAAFEFLTLKGSAK